MTAIQYISQLSAVADGSASAADLIPVTQGSTGSGTGNTRKMTLAEAAAGIGLGFNVLAFGAVGNGVANDTAAILAALSAVPAAGGTVVIPAGYSFMFNAPLVAKSNTVISGSGTLKAAPMADWDGLDENYGITNENADAVAITDENITITGITIDYTDFPAVSGTRHCFFFRMAQNIRIENVTTINGSSAVAMLACDNTQEIGNSYIDFTNCGSDHWDQPGNTRVVGCHIKSASSAQMVNFNPEPITGPATGYVAKNFVFTGNTIDATGSASTIPCIIAPLGSNTTVRNIVIADNDFTNSYLVVRGDTANGTITGNTFSGFASGSEAITGYTNALGTPAHLVVAGNTIRDAITTVGNLGVIRLESNSSTITNNIVEGVGYASEAFYTGSSTCQKYGNYNQGTQSSGYLQTGIRMQAGSLNTNFWGWTDFAGNTPRMGLQGDLNWIFASTNTDGSLRTALSIFAGSSTAEMIASVPWQFDDVFRTPIATVAAAGTVIGTATALAANKNNVTTCTAGVADGVVLAPVIGRQQIVINSTADTLKVYPNNSGSSQIDAGGAGVATTIAAGKSKTFEYVLANDFRTVAAT